MSPLPLPVRVAAGLAATAVDQARKLPAQLTGLPVTVLSSALQASMRVQQQITSLAIRGDEVFALFRPVDDTAPWARFDEDEVRAEQRNGERPDSAAAPAPAPQPVAERRGGELDEAEVARELAPEDATTPAALPGYDALTLPQLRGKLRMLSLPQLEELLAYEVGHQDRPAFVTMLSNRISTVRSR